VKEGTERENEEWEGDGEVQLREQGREELSREAKRRRGGGWKSHLGDLLEVFANKNNFARLVRNNIGCFGEFLANVPILL
jgi:hypothetical protein